jgi:hypothetical protein
MQRRPCCLSGADIFSPTSPAHAQESFFKDNMITIVQGPGPGGTGGQRVRALVAFLRRYIPGSPTIVMEYCQ